MSHERKTVPNNLVPALTSFVGREAEIDAVRGLLDSARLVTVTGPPGAGKTRLASIIAERLLDQFEDGAWFVGLAPIGDPDLVVPTVAETLGVRQPAEGTLVDALGAYLRNRRTLIVLDNFEQITEAATAIPALLAGAPGLTVLVTSRRLLRLSGEHEYPLPPLELPRPDRGAGKLPAESVDLFVRRASASLPGFRLDADNASQVDELCRRLDGLPLAIELAAARVKLMPLPAILARLDRRLGLLTEGPRDAPVRHQSLRAAVAWSYDLLEPAAQRLFRQLSVFRGGWTVPGAVALRGGEASDQGAVLDTLASLLDASLLVRDASAADRFTMLETLREFAAERLDESGEAGATRARQASYCLELVEQNEPEFTGVDRAGALDRVSIEHDNVRAALEYLLVAEPTDALRLATHMWRFWQMRGHLFEGTRWLNTARAAAGERAPDALRAMSLGASGGLAYWRGDMAAAQALYEAALEVRRRIGDPAGIADALYDLAFVPLPIYYPGPEDVERTRRATRLGEEARELFTAAGDERGIAKSTWLLGTVLLTSDIPAAVSQLRTSVERYRGFSDSFGLGWALYSYGDGLMRSGDSAAAAEALGEALELFAAANDGSAMGMLLDDFAKVADAEGDALRAARLRGAAAGTRRLTEAEIAMASDPVPASAAGPQGHLDPASMERAWTEGRAMSVAEATAYALRANDMAAPDRALRVTTLGPFHVERGQQAVSHWGGPKAGSRQAQAMFAFLLDRGERGVTKDEFVEVIWPDAELTQADLNFHRTLAGLRSTLEPGEPSGSRAGVLFSNGRYRLGPGLVGWLDAEEFELRLANAGQATDDLAAIRGLEAAHSLYRGDYLDDCPIYGDSGYVEEHRRFLRGRLTDALVDLGRRYEKRGDPSLAAARFREALQVSGGDCPSATDGLERLGVAQT